MQKVAATIVDFDPRFEIMKAFHDAGLVDSAVEHVVGGELREDRGH